jgi:hypothetical protein
MMVRRLKPWVVRGDGSRFAHRRITRVAVDDPGEDLRTAAERGLARSLRGYAAQLRQAAAARALSAPRAAGRTRSRSRPRRCREGPASPPEAPAADSLGGRGDRTALPGGAAGGLSRRDTRGGNATPDPRSVGRAGQMIRPPLLGRH